jgi:hypothetical protein
MSLLSLSHVLLALDAARGNLGLSRALLERRGEGGARWVRFWKYLPIHETCSTDIV